MRYPFSLDDCHYEIYYSETPAFKKVREECLSEDNWLKKNYTTDSLIVEEHSGFGVVYKTSTGEPIVMGGVYRDPSYPEHTARMINRTFTFPKFRSRDKSCLLLGFQILHKYLIYPLMDANEYTCYIITMQNRYNRITKGWWDIWKYTMSQASNGLWIPGKGYVQTKNVPVQKCWQNFVYCGGPFTLPTITQEEWSNLPEGN